MNKKNILIFSLELILIISFIMILVLVLNENISSFDNTIYNFISNFINNPTTRIMKVITFLGSAYTLITLTVLLILFGKDKKYFGINLVFIFIFNFIIKNIICRPRPVGHNLITEHGYSFPSGHSMVGAAVYGLLIYYIYKNVKNKIHKWLLIIFLSLLIIGIGISRIYLGVHYPSDVLGGYLLALVWLIILIIIIERNKK